MIFMPGDAPGNFASASFIRSIISLSVFIIYSQ